MFSQLVSRIIILVLGNLYPAYASFKAVKSKNAREYARWMMYWIVFAIFAVLENFTDIFLSWFPFYYELKILFVVWLLLPTFKGSSFIYRKLLHPYLVKNEQEIDQYIERSKELGSQALVTLGKQGIDVAQRTIAQKGPVWRSVSAQYLDQIMSNRDIDYNAEDQTDTSEVISQRVASRVPSKQRAIPSSTARDQQPQIRHRTNSQAGNTLKDSTSPEFSRGLEPLDENYICSSEFDKYQASREITQEVGYVDFPPSNDISVESQHGVTDTYLNTLTDSVYNTWAYYFPAKTTKTE